MIVFELLTYAAMVAFIGLVVTQFIVPTIKNEQTWWLFKKHSTKKKLSKLYIELASAQDEQQVKRIEKEIAELNK